MRIGGRPAAARTSGGYLVLDRTWHDRDTVELRLPMRTAVRTWGGNGGSVSVDHGPLTYALRIEEDWTRFAGTDDWPEYEVRAGSPWNYALEVDAHDPARSFTLERTRAHEANPFTQSGTPLRMRAKGRRVEAWQADDQDVAAPLQPGPARTAEPVEPLTLVPAAAARLRITSFPTAGAGAGAVEWAACTASFSGVDSPQALLMNAAAQPASSYDQDLPRFTWWDRTGTEEWVAYTYAEPVRVGGVSAYWYDDTGHGACRVPQSWLLEYLAADGTWQQVGGGPAYGTAADTFNEVSFPVVTTTALRVRVQLRPTVSGGLLAWRVALG